MSVTVETLIEAALLTSESPLTDKQLRQLWTPILPQDALVDVLANLQARWSGRALQLVNTVEGWRFQIVAEAYSELKEKLAPEKAPRYSRAVLETLAIIAYQQPVTRGDIEAIRGVNVSTQVMQTLSERGWIEVIGHKEVLGRPALWATTPQFLMDLGLDDLTQLPPLTELGELVLPDITPPAADDAAEEE
ncbi:MAG: SMC-Scp complex subunit ScpB [Neisseriaceae bacterium]|nr:SMC-Scp complex subunit ScpB [Neisseriaceae bacterium]MBP6861131.1 SMC-Scp complex subunit ScpB [Neisseriaceae bacterium]